MDDLERLHLNTTHALIEDIEALRRHLDIRSWLVHGVSWGSTLALAYALERPERITQVVLMAVTTGSREEIDRITEGVGRLFPEAWEAFAAAAEPGERIVEAYARLLRSPDVGVRAAAAQAWDSWESTHVSLDPHHEAGPLHDDAVERATFATLVTHYWANDCFLQGEDCILDRVADLASIPGVLVHGRHDVSGPAITPWRLHRRWPGSELVIVEHEGHGGPEMSRAVTAAIQRFAR